MRNDYFQPLMVSLTGALRHFYDVKAKLPAHEFVLRPLIEASKQVYVYGIKKNEYLYTVNSNILKSFKGKFIIDSTKECFDGHEELWNSTTWKRGSIVIIIEPNKIDLGKIFKNTYWPGIDATPNSGDSAAAIKLCKNEMKNGNLAFCLPASNGIEWMTIYANDKYFDKIHKLAKTNCIEPNYYGIK